MVINPQQKQNFVNIGLREQITRAMVNFHYHHYHYFTYKNKHPWSVNNSQLLAYPEHTTGYHLGHFLQRNNLQLIPKFENHDVFHIVLGYGLTVPDEIAMQCCLAASGRRTVSTAITIMIGIVLYPEYWKYFLRAYRRGQKLHNFSYWNFKTLLNTPLAELQQRIIAKH